MSVRSCSGMALIEELSSLAGAERTDAAVKVSRSQTAGPSGVVDGPAMSHRCAEIGVSAQCYRLQQLAPLFVTALLLLHGSHGQPR